MSCSTPRASRSRSATDARCPRGSSGSISRSGSGWLKLEGRGPWPAATLGDSTMVAAGDTTGTVGVSDEGDLVATPSRVQAVRPFAAAWEYMLDRAFIVTPVQCRLRRRRARRRRGQRDRRDLAAPGRGASRQPGHPHRAVPRRQGRAAGAGPRRRAARPRPWLGLYTESVDGGVVVSGMSPVGPARAAGFRRGRRDRPAQRAAGGEPEEFYRELWQAPMDQDVRVTVRRARRDRGHHRPADGSLPFLSDLRQVG